MRQPRRSPNDPSPGASVSTLACNYPRGSQVAPHAHRADQLIYASQGVMQVSAGRHLWVIPPQFGLWIPAGTVHQIRMPERVFMRTLYLRPSLRALPAACTVLSISGFLRELILEIVRAGNLHHRRPLECALRDLLVAELRRAAPVHAMVALPSDQRALAVAQAAIHSLAAPIPLRQACAAAGVSVRTLERIFRREVGTDFETWRRQLRLMKAIELLVSGCSVKEAAFQAGYQQANPLVALFRKTFGVTPKAWVSALNRSH